MRKNMYITRTRKKFLKIYAMALRMISIYLFLDLRTVNILITIKRLIIC